MPVDAVEDLQAPRPGPRLGAGGRSICVGSPVTIMRAFSPRRVRNIFICIDVVFCASSRMTAALASVRPRMKASGAISMTSEVMRALDLVAGHHVVERVVERAEIGIDLLLHVAGQEAEALAGLDGRARQDDAVDRAALEQRRGMGDGQIGLAGAGRADAEHQFGSAPWRAYRRPASGVRAWIVFLRVRDLRHGEPPGLALQRRQRQLVVGCDAMRIAPSTSDRARWSSPFCSRA